MNSNESDKAAAASPAPAPERVEFYRHNIGPAEIEAITRVLGTVFLSTGPEVAAFEREFAAFVGVPNAVAVSSCTAALQLALAGLNIGPGDEVITTPMSFVATANAILYAGATPVFVDVEPETGNLDAARVEAAITERTRAVLPVHLYGHMVDMRTLAALCEKRGLALIEDSAHCVEGQRDGLRPGQGGHAACFSFYATKNITGGEGGMLVARDADLAARFKRLRNHGIDRDAASRYGARYVHWNQVELGFKANMPDIAAALLRPQLARIDALLEARRRLVGRYDAAFSDIPGVRPLKVAPGCQSAHHLYTLLVPADRRDDILWGLGQRAVGVTVNYRAVHLNRYYRERFGFCEGMFPVAEEIGARTITLPLYPTLSFAAQDRAIAAVRDVVTGG